MNEPGNNGNSCAESVPATARAFEKWLESKKADMPADLYASAYRVLLRRSRKPTQSGPRESTRKERLTNMTWQPIETAPRDGTWFVICNANDPRDHYEVGRYDPYMIDVQKKQGIEHEIRD